MTYREPLDTAYRTISRLEAQLAERDARIASLEARRPPPRNEPPESPPLAMVPTDGVPAAVHPAPRHPAHAAVWLVAAAAALSYVVRFGGVLPSSPDDLLPLASGWHASLVGAATLLGLRDLSLRHAGRTTPRDRILLVLAVLVGLPFAIPASLAVITIGGPILGALCVIASAVAGLVWLVRWISKGVA